MQISPHQWDNNSLKDQILNGMDVERLPKKGDIVAIDAEFVTINQVRNFFSQPFWNFE